MINQLIDEYGLDVVLSYMGYIQVIDISFKKLELLFKCFFKSKNTAEQSVRSLMRKHASESESKSNDNKITYFQAEEFMDDGSNLNISIAINEIDVNNLTHF